MTSITDKAAQDDVDVILSREAHGVYRIISPELDPAEDVGAEDGFPQHGEFLPVTKLSRGGEPQGEARLECPSGLAAELADQDLIEPDTDFWIRNVAKGPDNAWVFQVEAGLPPGE